MMNERQIQAQINNAYVASKVGRMRVHIHIQVDINVNERAKHLYNVPMM